MLAAERQNLILRQARKIGTVRTTALAAEYEVTEETIRRDLEKLGHAGLLVRTHGGAMYSDLSRQDLSHRDRETRQAPQKAAIAKTAASLINEGDTVLLDASSTSLALASALPDNITVVTYALPVVERLSVRDGLNLVQLGGTFHPDGRRFSGLLTENALGAINIDRFFFSGKGLDPEQGISEADEEQARLKRLIIKQAAWSCAMIDDSKIAVRSNYYFAAIEDIDALVVNDAAQTHLEGHALPCPVHVSKKATA